MFNPDLVDRLFKEVTGEALSADTLHGKIDEYVKFARISDKELQEKLMKYQLPDNFAGASAYNGEDYSYLSGGAYHALTVANAIGRHLQQDQDCHRILDFGVGMGRLLRFFNLFAPHNEYVGWEVNPDSVNYLKTAFPASNEFKIIPAKPPIEIECESFDAVYAWSIWTHFEERLARSWLENLLKFVRPGGLLLFTLHNNEIVERYGTEDKLRERMVEKNIIYADVLSDYEENGFAFWRWYPEKARQHGIDIDTFGMAFITRQYVYDNWTDLFKVEEIVDNAAQGWQDLLVCRKR